MSERVGVIFGDTEQLVQSSIQRIGRGAGVARLSLRMVVLSVREGLHHVARCARRGRV